MKWCALFSQTGSEINEVSKRIGRYPDVAITNGTDWDKINKELIDNVVIKYVDLKPTSDDYRNFLMEDSVITLNGWLRIVPKDICDEYTIYNGHPGLITEYPELKGKDPQERAYNGDYTVGGCVIHEVTPEVDEGCILYERSGPIDGLSLDDVYKKLHGISVNLWVDFLKDKLNEELHNVQTDGVGDQRLV